MRKFETTRVAIARLFTQASAIMILVLASTSLPAQGTPPPGYTLEIVSGLPTNAIAFSLNNSGTMIGFYFDVWGGWKLENGQFTDIVHPMGQTNPTAINDQGTVFGYYEGVPGGPERVGFSISSNGTITDYVVPGPDVFATRVLSGNIRGDIVGSYERTSSGTREAFIRNKKGVYTDITPPDSLAAEATDITDTGMVTGYYFSSLDLTLHGFLYKNGAFTIIDHPDLGTTVYGTDVVRSNSRGESVGHNYTSPALDQNDSFLRTNHGAFIDVSYTDSDPFFLFHFVDQITEQGDILGNAAYFSPIINNLEIVNYILRH